MANEYKKVSNPLTLIAIFAGTAEVVTSAALPFLEADVQGVFVWFVMLFPAGLVLAFFLTLNFNTKVLYAPSDYSDEENFMRNIRASYAGKDAAADKLRAFWKPRGRVNANNERRLRDWLESQGIGEISITMFLRSKIYESIRTEAVKELGLQ